MSPAICPKCGHARQPQDTECPSCGIIFAKYTPRAKPMHRAASNKVAIEFWGKVTLIAIGAGILIFSWLFMKSNKYESSQPRVEAKTVYNSPYDGSVRQVEKYLRATLKDPDSFSAIEWSSVAEQAGGGFVVRCKFRAKNSFGGFVIENHMFTLDSSGNVIGSHKIE